MKISFIEEHFKQKLNMLIWCGSLLKILIWSYNYWKQSCWKVLLLVIIYYMENLIIENQSSYSED